MDRTPEEFVQHSLRMLRTDDQIRVVASVIRGGRWRDDVERILSGPRAPLPDLPVEEEEPADPEPAFAPPPVTEPMVKSKPLGF